MLSLYNSTLTNVRPRRLEDHRNGYNVSCLRFLPAVGLALLALTTQTPSVTAQQPGAETPEAMLKRSMSKYAATPTFQADCDWAVTYGSTSGTQAKRTIQYARPNKFKIVSAGGQTKFVQTSVSDGKKLVEYATGGLIPAQSYPAPASLADSKSMYLQHPMFCGTLLYKFFGGASQFTGLVDTTKQPLVYGPPVTLSGQNCRTLTFWAKGMYGKTEIAIGINDSLVHRIRYGSEPLMEQTKKMMQSSLFQDQIKKAGKGIDTKQLQKMMPSSSQTTETYTNIVLGGAIAPSVFAANAPKGQQPMDMSALIGSASSGSPVPLGKSAPEITVTGMDGVPKKLNAFRGKVVMLDFWATWCPPCRKGLPETNRFHQEFGSKGLAVLAISDEKKATVAPFLTQNKYTFPTYLDKGDVTNKAYHISGIPTVAIIDKNGNLSSYLVGLSSRETLLAALKKAGLQTN